MMVLRVRVKSVVVVRLLTVSPWVAAVSTPAWSAALIVVVGGEPEPTEVPSK